MASFPKIALSQADKFSIVEVNPNAPDLPGANQLELSGRGLPYRGVSFATNMRGEFTWYNGNPIGTAQMLGASEDPTSINGMWKNRFLSDVNGSLKPPILLNGATAITSAMEAIKRVREFVVRGQLLRVTWLGIVRYGFMTRLEHKWWEAQDVEWEMKFDWISDGVNPDYPIGTDQKTLITDVDQTWQDQKDKLSQVAIPLYPLRSDTAVSIDQAISSVVANISSIEDSISDLLDAVFAPVDTARKLIAVVTNMQDSADIILEEVRRRPAFETSRLAYSLHNSNGTSNQVSVAEELKAHKYRRGLITQANAIKSQAALQKSDLATTASPNLLALFVAREDMDLRTVSTKYYGSPDQWKSLMRFNGLSTSRLRAGQTVAVPMLAQTVGF